ncbi:MAG: Rap1a/Tai family immunity protein [Halopseudomonas aestusnigri]
MKCLVVLIVTVLLWAESAQAYPTQGELLYDFCNSGKETAVRSFKNHELLSMPGNFLGTKQGIFCIGYIQAVEDDLSQKGEICLSNNPTGVSFIAILYYFDSHPELARKNARIAVTAALKETHPCS